MSMNSELSGSELIALVAPEVHEDLPVMFTGNNLLAALQSLDHGLVQDVRNPACLSLSLRLVQ